MPTGREHQESARLIPKLADLQHENRRSKRNRVSLCVMHGVQRARRQMAGHICFASLFYLLK